MTTRSRNAIPSDDTPHFSAGMSVQFHATFSMDEETRTITNLDTEDMQMVQEAKQKANPRYSVSDALRTGIAYVRRSYIRREVRIVAPEMIFRAMAAHQEDNCQHMDEHAELYITYLQALIDPRNGMKYSRIRVENIQEEIRQAELALASFRAARAAGTVFHKCPATVGIEYLRAPKAHVHDERCGTGVGCTIQEPAGKNNANNA
ncbi:uncharacterized protein AB675_5403 [Cyphellophora attinorum]|uniref:Uncharacterized protein n=1 Tax=Cyphellophora attinorum TaxID=1664694 RepID=A0A0N0NNN1_9EURO|nr:uncharacterized protein AB675_5403 [Phialophora attinorum]KPI41791.1 hypothetical protein AB675_5403 [Phialophora attinorum]